MIKRLFLAGLAAFSGAAPAWAGSLDGKTFIIEMSSSQYASGYAEYLVPPLAKVLARSRMKPMKGPGADVAINIVTHSDGGQWVGEGEGRQWLYTVSITVGISPGDYGIPVDGTPKFGVRASLVTPDGDREDELACLIGLAAEQAIDRYRLEGLIEIDGAACLRK